MPSEHKEYNEHIQSLLKTVCDNFEKEDSFARQRQIVQWKKLEYMWEGFQRLWWSEVAHDWRVFDAYNTEGYSDQASYYDKPINIFRAYLETIIAAMSAAVPPVKCTPDNADDINDVLTAKGGTKISELIYKHNDAPLLWMHALFIFVTQGMIAAYHYTDEDEAYGLVDVDKYEPAEEEVDQYICPICKKELQGQELEFAIKQELSQLDEYQPEETEINAATNNDQVICPNCQAQINPELTKQKITVTKFVGKDRKPKSRQCIEVYGGLYVKVPNYAKCQGDIPYLRFSKEEHYTKIFSDYPNLRKKSDKIISASSNDTYERWGRLSPQYGGDYPINTPTVHQWWLRPCAFNVINEESDRKLLEKEFPKGVKVVYVNEFYAEACPRVLDDDWTLTENPLSEYLHFNPMGDLLVSVQEITNDLISLILQTIEHGIPQTFADSKVLNFESYRNMEIAPGSILPATAKSGKTLADGFFTVKTATLSQEVMPFGEKIQELGQFTSGALPSLYGGDQSNSSRTAAQYQMSKASSLQRLQISWKMLNFWWKNIFGKVIPAYIETMLDDEYLVKEQDNNFINIAIRRSELDGKIGSVELEASDELPITFAQKRDIIMQMLQSQNPEVLNALADPGNLPLIADAIGLADFILPGEADREKQFEEISLLLKSEPIGNQPSIMPVLEVDNHKIESETCRYWLVSEPGRQAKIMNPQGYANVLLHMKIHIEMLQSLAPTAPDESVGKAEPVIHPGAKLNG